MSRNPMPDSERRLTDERRDLAATCYPMARKLARRFAYRWRLDEDECLSHAMMALCDAARTYRPGLSKFSGHVWRSVSLRLRQARTSGLTRLHIGTWTEPDRVGIRTVGDFSGLRLAGGGERQSADLDPLLSRLAARERAVLVMRYWLGWTYAEAGRSLGLTGESIRKIERKALAKMRA